MAHGQHGDVFHAAVMRADHELVDVSFVRVEGEDVEHVALLLDPFSQPGSTFIAFFFQSMTSFHLLLILKLITWLVWKGCKWAIAHVNPCFSIYVWHDITTHLGANQSHLMCFHYTWICKNEFPVTWNPSAHSQLLSFDVDFHPSLCMRNHI